MLDTGATHNFINEDFVAQCKLQVEDFYGFRVRVANGYTLICTRKVANLTLRLNNYELHSNFFLVNMGEIDIVLGMKWLHDLGVFTLNVLKMEMYFEVDGRRHVLRGITDGGFNSIRGLYSKRKKKVIQEKPEMILNSLFRVEASWSYDNPLYGLDDDISLDFSLKMSIVDSICDPASALGLQIGLTEEILEVYMVRNSHNFIFYSHVHDLFMMHNSRAHVLKIWDDSMKFGGKVDQSLGLLPLEAYTSTTLDDVIELV